MFYCYILKSQKNNRYYVGSTEDFKNRLNLHNAGMVKSTKDAVPWEKVFIQSFSTLREAKRRESQIKNWKSRKAIERLIKTFNF